MPGDYSRKLFDAKKHYSAVLEQQGRVQLDADWNESVNIQQHRISTETTDVIGATGVPKENGGFDIIPFADGSDFTILPGRIYVDGILFESEEDTITYRNQPYYPNPDIDDFYSFQASPPGSPVHSSLNDGNYIVYFEGWQKEITYHDDPSIQEVALGEADTTTRLQNVWQVKLLKVSAIISPDCNTAFVEWDAVKAVPSGKLSAQVIINTDEEKPCSLPPGSGYTGLENQLYRIQILKGGARSTATFVWSRDNASVETNIIGTTSNSVTVTSIGKDDVLGFANGQWVEVLNDDQTLTKTSLVQIDSIDEAQLSITFKIINSQDNGIPAYEPGSVLKLRRWDVAGFDMRDGIAMTGDWINIEGGIQVKFDDDNYQAGDYWLIPARTATGKIEWPYTTSQSPVGIKRHYGKLGILIAKSGQVGFIDCRPKFSTLTNICAENICFDNINCDLLGATTVQQALDILCERSSGGSCTIVVSPRDGWEDSLNVLEDGMDAQICFQVGDYPLSKPVIFKNKGNLKLEGCGPATRIISSAAEAAFVFDHCKTVIVKDIYAEGGTTDANQVSLTTHLNGVLNFLSCEAINIDHISIKSGISDTRNCTCITVNNDVNTPGSVRIENCDLQIANQQQGILIINTTSCWITKNSLQVYTLNNKGFSYKPGIRNLLASDIKSGSPFAGVPIPPTRFYVSSGQFVVNFTSDSSMATQWQQAMDTVFPTTSTSQEELLYRVKQVAKRMIADQSLRSQFSVFNTIITNASLPVKAIGSKAITIGGQIAKNVYIEDNIITDVLEGIHAGVSHRTNVRQPDSIDNLSIRNNSISISVPITVGTQDRYGIFVGNCKTLLIENNKVFIERLLDANNIIPVEGIRVWGNRGLLLIISQNMVTSVSGAAVNSFTTGINVQPGLDQTFIGWLWKIMFNVVYAKIQGITNTIANDNNVVVTAAG